MIRIYIHNYIYHNGEKKKKSRMRWDVYLIVQTLTWIIIRINLLNIKYVFALSRLTKSVRPEGKIGYNIVRSIGIIW